MTQESLQVEKLIGGAMVLDEKRFETFFKDRRNGFYCIPYGGVSNAGDSDGAVSLLKGGAGLCIDVSFESGVDFSQQLGLDDGGSNEESAIMDSFEFVYSANVFDEDGRAMRIHSAGARLPQKMVDFMHYKDFVHFVYATIIQTLPIKMSTPSFINAMLRVSGVGSFERKDSSGYLLSVDEEALKAGGVEEDSFTSESDISADITPDGYVIRGKGVMN